MPNLEQLKELMELITHGGSALLAAIMLVLYWMQRKDLETSRKRVVELENRVFELSTAYNRTVRKFEGGFSQTRELLTRIYDRL